MILRRSSTPPPTSIIVFAAIGFVAGLLALGVGMCLFSRRKWEVWRGERLLEGAREVNSNPRNTRVDSREVAREESFGTRNIRVDSNPPHINPLKHHISSLLPPHMNLGYPAGWIGGQPPKSQDGGQTPQRQESMESSQLERAETQGSLGLLRHPTPMGFRYEGYRSRTPPVHLKLSTTSATTSQTISTRNGNPNPIPHPPAAHIPRTTTPKPLPPSRSTTPNPPPPRSNASTPIPVHILRRTTRNNSFHLPVIPASARVLDTRPPRPPATSGDASSSGSEYSQPSNPPTSDPGTSVIVERAMAKRLKALAPRPEPDVLFGSPPPAQYGSPNPCVGSPPARVGSPYGRVASPPTPFGSPQARVASPPVHAPRPLPLTLSTASGGKHRLHSLHAYFTPVKADAPPLPLPLPPLPTHSSPSGEYFLGLQPSLRPSSSHYTLNKGRGGLGEREETEEGEGELTESQKAYFPPELNMNMSPLGVLEAKLQQGQHQNLQFQPGTHQQNTPYQQTLPNQQNPTIQRNTYYHQQIQNEGGGSNGSFLGGTTDDSTTSTSHGEATNVAFANSLANKTWAQRCAEDGKFKNKFEALLASDVGDEGGAAGGKRPLAGAILVLFWIVWYLLYCIILYLLY